MLSRSKILKADPTFISVLSIIISVHWQPEPAISMLYAMQVYACVYALQRWKHLLSGIYTANHTRPIRIALNVTSEVWGGEHWTSRRVVKLDRISVIRKWLVSSDISLALTSNEELKGKLKSPVSKTLEWVTLTKYPGRWVYSQKNLVGVCSSLLKTFTLFMTKTAEKPYPLGPHIPT